MEVCMSKTQRGKYTDNRICYISKCKGDMRLYLRRKGKLPCFSYLVRGKSFSFYRGKILKRFESRLVQFGSSFIQTCFFEKKIVFLDKKTSFSPLFLFNSHIVQTMGP